MTVPPSKKGGNRRAATRPFPNSLRPEPAMATELAGVKWLEQGLITLLVLSGIEEVYDEEGEPHELDELPEDPANLRKELEQRSEDDPRTVYGLARRFGLDPVARDILLLAFAPELDQGNRMWFSAVSELMSPDGRPTVGFMTHLLADDQEERLMVRAALAPRGPLRRHRLVEVVQQGGAAEAEAVVTLPPAVRDLLLGHGFPPPGKPLYGVAEEAPDHVPPVFSLAAQNDAGTRAEEGGDTDTNTDTNINTDPDTNTDTDTDDTIRITIWQHSPPGPLRGTPVLVVGEHPGDRRATAAALAARQSLPVLIRRIEPADSRHKEAAAVADLVRDARLHGAVAVAELDAVQQQSQAPLLSFLLSTGTVPLDSLVLAMPHDLSGAVPEATAGCTICEAQPVDFDAQRRRWTLGLEASGIPEERVDLDALAGRFHLEPWSIRAAVERAKLTGPVELDPAVLMEAARSMAGRRAVTHARRLRPRYTLPDMVLPDKVREHLTLLIGFAVERERLLHRYGFARRFTMGHGLVVLFSGESGTGKTMAGEVLANALERDLYIVDLSQLVSKWVGETEKHIDQVFTEAEEAHGVLLFDEADALFGNRTSDVSSSNDRYANLEVGYLLQRVESFRGVAVLTTNLNQNIDDAFRRRFHFRLDLPRPTPDLRRQLWQKMLPPDAYEKDGLDLSLLAHRFDFTGGNIRNALLKATYLADREHRPLAQRHLMEASTTESAELGRLVDWNY